MKNKWDLLEDFLSHIQLSVMDEDASISEHTLKARKNDLSQFLEDNEPLTASTLQIRSWFLSFKGTKWKKANTFRRKIDSVKYFYKFLNSEGHMNYNPATNLQYPRRPKIYKRTGFTAAQLKKLVYVVDSVNVPLLHRVIFYTLITTGLRSSELCSIKKVNLNLKNRMIYIPREDNKGKRVDKRVFFSAKTKDLIERYINEDMGYGGEYLFHVEDGTKLYAQKIYPIIENFIAIAFPSEEDWSGPLGPHLLRHTFATIFLESEGDRTALQHMMGYTTQHEIETYARTCGLSMDFINAQARKVQRVFKKKYKI